MSLQIKGIEDSIHPRDNYWCIMDVSCINPTISVPEKDIWQIYYCKSYLQVKWTSDIYTTDGSRVLCLVTNGICSIQQSCSRKKVYCAGTTVWSNLDSLETFLLQAYMQHKMECIYWTWQLESESEWFRPIVTFLLLTTEWYTV